jgi:hypothetical protein
MIRIWEVKIIKMRLSSTGLITGQESSGLGRLACHPGALTGNKDYPCEFAIFGKKQ